MQAEKGRDGKSDPALDREKRDYKPLARRIMEDVDMGRLETREGRRTRSVERPARL